MSNCDRPSVFSRKALVKRDGCGYHRDTIIMGNYRRKPHAAKDTRLITAEALSACGIGPSDTALVGLSGGADSVALLLALLDCVERGELAGVSAAHLHHGVRGEEAERDMAFCVLLCERLSVPILTRRADVPALAKRSGDSIETAGRLARYEFLEEARKHFAASCIAVAHHRDDQAETVLMHLLRGAGLSGLIGMKRRNGHVVRPLLDVSKRGVLDYLSERNQPFCLDSTNEEAGARRNSIRLTVLPAMESVYSGAAERIADCAQLLREDEEYLCAEAESLLAAADLGDGRFDRKALAAASAPLSARALMKLLGSELCRADIDGVRALLTAQTGTEIALSGGRRAIVDAEALCVGFPQQKREFSVPFCADGETVFPGGRFMAGAVPAFTPPDAATEAYVDLDRLPAEAVVRTRRPGDRFFPLGGPGERLLSDCMTDRKLPRRRRDLPLLASGEQILWMPGYTVSNDVRVTGETRAILHIVYEEDGRT